MGDVTSRLALPAAVLALLTAAPLAGCSSASTSAPASLPATASAPAASPSAPASPAGDSASGSASASAAKACAELDAWQKQHGNSAAPPQQVFNDMINAPEPLSGDFTAWDLTVHTGSPDEKAALLKVWTDCAKAEAAALEGK